MPYPGGVASSAPYSGGPALAPWVKTFQLAVVNDCHTPLKFGLPFASRGMSAGREPCACAFAASSAHRVSNASVDRIIALFELFGVLNVVLILWRARSAGSSRSV